MSALTTMQKFERTMAAIQVALLEKERRIDVLTQIHDELAAWIVDCAPDGRDVSPPYIEPHIMAFTITPSLIPCDACSLALAGGKQIYHTPAHPCCAKETR